MKVLIVPDKFKGTLTAESAAAAMARGWRKRQPRDALEVLPLSDGGDGFGQVMGRLLGAKVQVTRTVDAARRPCSSRWWWEPRTGTAIIESATAIGLAMLPPQLFHPFELDTFGLGRLFQAAAAKGARRCLIGIGGSATNDAGFGMARALGWEFLDDAGRAIERWTELPKLAALRRPPERRFFKQFVVAVDVANPLLGAKGATRVYGPQKGIRPEDYRPAERCLRRLAQVCAKQFSQDLSREPGAGAAGGLGFGLATFLDARLEPGFDLFAAQARLEERVRSADLVLTGEGAIDDSTLMGKGVGRVAALCRSLGIPCLGLAGLVKVSSKRRSPFTRMWALTELTSVEQAKANAELWLGRLAERAAAEVSLYIR